MDMPVSSTEVKKAKSELYNNPQIKTLVAETSQWFPESITRHNDPQLQYHKLRMLADFGLDSKDKGIHEVIERATEHLEHDMFAV